MNLLLENIPKIRSEYLFSIMCSGVLWFTTVLPYVSAQVISDEQRSTAQIRKSREANRLIQEGISERENGNLSTFIDNLQKARENYKNWIVPAQSQEGLFIGVQYRTFDLLMTLGQNGRETYREKFEKKARAALKKAKRENNPAAIFDVADQYPLTNTALDALNFLGKRRFKEGNFNRALVAFKELYRLQPNQNAKISAAKKIAFCLTNLGKVTALKTFRNELPAQLRSKLVSAQTSKGTLSAFLDKQIERARNRRNNNQTVSDSRNWSPNERGPSSPAIQLKNAQGNELHPKILFSIPEGASKTFQYNRIRRRSARGTLKKASGVYPLIVDGHILLNNGVSCWGWNLPDQTHTPLTEPTWSFSVEEVTGSDVMQDERLIFRGTAANDGNYFCALATSLGKQEKQMIKLQVRFPIPWRSLFSINASEGEVNWKRGGPSDQGFAKNASFPSGATHDDGILYATAVKFQTSKDTPDLYGTAIDASSGDILWSTFLTKNMLGTNLFENPIREVVPDVPLVDKNNVYLNTNTGVIAALNRETGNLKWLYRYMQWPLPETESIYPKRQSTYWPNNLPLRIGDTLLFTPTNSIRLIAMDRKTGGVKWVQKQPKLHKQLNGFARWLVPMENQRYLLASNKRIIIYSATNGKQISQPIDTSAPIEGRPAVLKNYIALPTQKGIKLIRYDNKQNDMIPLSKEGTLSSSKFYRPGNVFFYDNHILITGPEQFSYFQLLSN